MSNLLHGGGGIRHDAGDHRAGENSVGHGGELAGQEAIRYLRKVQNADIMHHMHCVLSIPDLKRIFAEES